MQKVLFPMKCLAVSQGYGFTVEGVNGSNTYSHAGQKALDLRGRDSGTDAFYAPFDCVVKRITEAYNCVYFQSLEEVECRNGYKGYVCFRCMHISDSLKAQLGLAVGRTFKQGEICYYEGVKGGATGNHVHVEFGTGKFTGTGAFMSSSGKYSINNPVFLNQICWVPSDVIIATGYGYQWVRIAEKIEDASEPEGSFANTGATSAGTKIILKHKMLYISSSGNNGIMKSNAIFYLYDGEPTNGRFRVCQSPSTVGKGLAYVSGWVAAEDIGVDLVESNTSAPATSTIISNAIASNAAANAKIGTRLILNGRLYGSSNGVNGVNKAAYICYIYDGKEVNGRYRVCKSQTYCNRGVNYVAGWVSAEDVAKCSR